MNHPDVVMIKHKDGYALINKEDFDEKKHKLHEEKEESKKSSKKEKDKE